MFDAGGERVVLVVRRMKCLNRNCGKIHHERPDVLIPYKMHTAIVFEKIIEQDTSEVPAEDSTIARIRAWFYSRADALVGALIGLYATLNRSSGIELSSYFDYPVEMRTLIYTTNAIEGYHRQLRKVTTTKTLFPTDTAVIKILYLPTMDVMAKWTQRVRNWDKIESQMEILFENRLKP